MKKALLTIIMAITLSIPAWAEDTSYIHTTEIEEKEILFMAIQFHEKIIAEIPMENAKDLSTEELQSLGALISLLGVPNEDLFMHFIRKLVPSRFILVNAPDEEGS